MTNIQDGDLVAVKSTSGGLAALIRLITGKPYTHTAIALRIDGALWLAEMDAGGNHLVPIEHIAHHAFDVFDFPGDRAIVRRCALDSLKGRIRYDLLDLLRIAFDNLFHLRLPRTDRGGMVCSSYSGWLWRGAGVRIVGPLIISPGALVEAIGGAPKLRVGEGLQWAGNAG